MPRSALPALVLALLALALGGCGGSGDAPADSATAPPPRADFPAVGGRTLAQLAGSLRGGLTVGLATTVYTPGRNRLAFGLLDRQNRFVDGPTAVYVAPRPSARAQGPFPALLDSLETKPAYTSQTEAQEQGGPKRIYEVRVPIRAAGALSVLAVTHHGGQLVGAATRIRVAASSPIPAVGSRPPAIDTPTRRSVGGDLSRIDTRVPPDDLHEVSFRAVLGHRPVALLFATPALCQSRVCGPVVDLAEQLHATYGDRIAFIHQEVYRDNVIAHGLRPQLTAFHLTTEPWLFTVTRSGRVAARLEGAFGLTAFRRALDAALR